MLHHCIRSHPHHLPRVFLMSPSQQSGVGSQPAARGWELSGRSRPEFKMPRVAGLLFPFPQAQALVQYLEEPLTQVAAS